jgi:hypothetical protein
MNARYQARWASRQQADKIKRNGSLNSAILLDTLKGPIVVEPAGSGLADGAVLSDQEIEMELQPVWFTGPLMKLRQARKLLGIPESAGVPGLDPRKSGPLGRIPKI